MLSKVNSFGMITVMAIALLLLACFASSAVYADGAGGQSPDPPPETIDGGGGQSPDPPPLNSPGDGSGDEGDTTFTDVIETVLFFII